MKYQQPWLKKVLKTENRKLNIYIYIYKYFKKSVYNSIWNGTIFSDLYKNTFYGTSIYKICLIN